MLLGHGENSIFEICNELKVGRCAKLNASAFEPATFNPQPFTRSSPISASPIASRAVFEQHRPEIVFHAAAHKHVPLMEEQPGEAITNNVLGTRNLLAAAGGDRRRALRDDLDRQGREPHQLMGATKRVAELLVHEAARRTGRPYVAVRFGNVLGSRGSVVPIFKQQIAAGGPVTVTHPEMTRFFMTIPEAVQLVLQAAALGHGGEVFVLDMGEPVRIVDLARDLIRAIGPGAGPRHRDRLHRPAAGREALRGAVHRRRGLRAHRSMRRSSSAGMGRDRLKVKG